jgi:phosphomevalonate decarboxylase
LKATAEAYAIQGLIKYHGLRNPTLRIPYHDSISVCMKSLPTVTTVSVDGGHRRDETKIDGKVPSAKELERIESVLDQLRRLGKTSAYFRIESRNPDVQGKGLGFSASGFAALGLAASRVLGLHLSSRELSQVVRLGAGSAARSLVGGFSIWYARKAGMSYAEQLASPDSIGLRTVIIPIPSKVKTDSAHKDVVRSPFFRARLKYLPSRLRRMKWALSHRNVRAICELAEEDTLNLHAITMTGREGLVLFSPLSIQVMSEIRRLREEEDVPVWFSLDTGPSVFANTTTEALPRVRKSLERLTGRAMVSAPGAAARLVGKHLF